MAVLQFALLEHVVMNHKITLVVCHQRVLEELGDISLRVDNVKDQAIILMTSRGPACRDVVEPKLSELNCNFDKVSQHIRTAQVQKCFCSP